MCYIAWCIRAVPSYLLRNNSSSSLDVKLCGCSCALHENYVNNAIKARVTPTEASYFLFPLPLPLEAHRWRPTIVEKGKRNRPWTCGEGARRGRAGDAPATRKLQSQFFARQILLPHSLKRFRSAASSITQNAFKLDTARRCWNGMAHDGGADAVTMVSRDSRRHALPETKLLFMLGATTAHIAFFYAISARW